MKHKKIIKLVILVLQLITLPAFANMPPRSQTSMRVLVLGNSMVAHGPAPEIGWTGNWGMAASEQKKDFVHLLENKLQARDPNVIVKSFNIANTFEKHYWDFDQTKLRALVGDYQPNIIIVRLGENIPVNMLPKESLEKGLVALVKFFAPDTKAKVFITNTFWENKPVSAIIKKTARAQNWHLVDLSKMGKRADAMALRQYTNKSVGMHPSDLGMAMIAEKIWDKIQQY